MKTHVSIDGVTLTRAQVEAAVKELNAPVVPVFKQGDIVKAAKQPSFDNSSRTYLLLLAGDTEKIVRERYKSSLGDDSKRLVCVCVQTGAVHSFLAEDLQKVVG